MEEIPFFRPDIGEEEIDAASKILKSGYLVLGSEVRSFEEKFAKCIGAEHCVATNSLTNGYLMVLEYLKPKWVDIPSMTFVSMATIPALMGIEIRFRDRMYMGRKYAIKTDNIDIVDSAHEIQRGMYENDGRFWLFSFHATKNITTGGQGGMIVCPDKESYEHFMQTRSCGMIRGESSWDYTVNIPGYHAYMNDYNACIGNVQLEKLDKMNAKRKEIVNLYNDLLGESNESLHLYTILVEERDKFIEYMKDNKIQCSVHYRPIHMQPAFSGISANLPKTEMVAKRIVSLPLYCGMKKNQIKYICDIVNEWRGK